MVICHLRYDYLLRSGCHIAMGFRREVNICVQWVKALPVVCRPTITCPMLTVCPSRVEESVTVTRSWIVCNTSQLQNTVHKISVFFLYKNKNTLSANPKEIMTLELVSLWRGFYPQRPESPLTICSNHKWRSRLSGREFIVLPLPF